MGLIEKIYDNSPIFLQNIMVSAKGFLNNKSRYGKEYYKYRLFLEDFDNWSFDKKKEYQDTELVKFIKFAYSKSPFYRELYKGIDLSKINGVEDLKLLPIVDKEMLRSNIKNVFSKVQEPCVESHTGGTTGKSLVVKMTNIDSMHRMAMLDHFKKRHGFEHRKMRRVTFNGKHIIPPSQKSKCFWRYNMACKQLIMSSFHLSEDNLQYYVNELNRFKPNAIDGFFSSMCDVANYIERKGLKLDFLPIAIFPTSETITEEGRVLLERVFGCKVYDQYASSEGAPFVTECKCGKLHIEMQTGVFEQFDDSNEILITSFSTHGTPLIRYRIGDKMALSKINECTCGISSLMVDSISGRKQDFLYNAEGVKINAGNVSNLFKNIPNAIIRVQLVQNVKNEVFVYLEIDKEKYKNEYDDIIKKEFEHTFGVNTKIFIHHVDKLNRENSGKFRMIVNNVVG